MNPVQLLQFKFITDPDFRQQLMDDPTTALTSVGIEPTEDILNLLGDLQNDIAEIAILLNIGVIDCI